MARVKTTTRVVTALAELKAALMLAYGDDHAVIVLGRGRLLAASGELGDRMFAKAEVD